tara:strand:- start:67 stop:423 length:357 start_codon:yes stop_codon:yes gene_type:complete
MKNLRPKFIENSKIPIILSKIAPIEIWAINIGPLVFCRGALSEDTKRHESIHFQQQIELLFIFHFILYFLFWIVGAIRYKNMKIAYSQSPFEKEAYDNEKSEDYLSKRKRFSWIRYIK